ncbi:MAG TPA: sialidase family protein [Frankiaceae bacterium]|nr:sialidase family protein [Frankiaceae bacterium]
MRRPLLLLGLTVAVAAATTASATRPDPRAAALGAAPGGFAAYHATIVKKNDPDVVPRNKPVRYSGPKLAFTSHYVGREAAEPTIGVDKRGRVFFPASTFDALPPGSPRQQAHTILLSSGDRGRTWRNVQPKLANQDAHPVSLDPYLFVDKVTGRIFNIDLLGAGSILSTSDDSGETWQTNPLTSAGVNDHQTLFTGPPPVGNPSMIPIDPAFPRIVYYCINSVAEATCAASRDGGRTFTQTGTFPFPGGYQPGGKNFGVCGSLHGHGVTDSKGRIYLPQGRCLDPTVAVSEDGGLTWRSTIVSPGVGASFVQTSVAVDAADNVYYTWWDDIHRLPYLSVSRDAGKTWGPAMMIAPPGVREVNWPTIDAGDPGRIAITFPGSTAVGDGNERSTDLSRPWNSYVVVSTNALSSKPLFLSNITNNPYDPIHRGNCNGRCGNMYDFLDIVVSPLDQGRVWATAVDTCTARDQCNKKQVKGANGDAISPSDGAASDMQGVAIRQVSGPALRGRAPYLAAERR